MVGNICVCVCMPQMLGCGPADYITQVQGLQAVKRDSGKTNKSLMDELAQLHGRELARLSAAQGLTPDPASDTGKTLKPMYGPTGGQACAATDCNKAVSPEGTPPSS